VKALARRGRKSHPRAPKILAIYESKTVLETVHLIDCPENVPLVSASSHTVGLAQIEATAPDIILVSAMAGQQQARDFISEIRALPRGRGLPVVMVAVQFERGERELAFKAGFNLCLELMGEVDGHWAQVLALAGTGETFNAIYGEKLAADERNMALARANAEAGRLVLDVEERDRRIRAQQAELTEHNRRLARANAEAGRLILEIEEKDRRLQEQSAEIEKHLFALRRDLALAADLQINLLPVEYPNVANLRLFDRFLPANELCGDYYDYILHPDGDFDVVVADVTGHGVASALVSVQIRAITRARGPFEHSPARTLDYLNDFMLANFHRQFLMTMFYLGYRAAGRDRPQLVYAGAGHPPPLLFRTGDKSIHELRSQGLPLGVNSASSYRDDVVDMSPGDRLLIHTDGIIEVYDGSRRQWGLDGLKRALAAATALPGREVIDHLLREARYFSNHRPFDDDVTVVLVEQAASD